MGHSAPSLSSTCGTPARPQKEETHFGGPRGWRPLGPSPGASWPRTPRTTRCAAGIYAQHVAPSQPGRTPALRLRRPSAGPHDTTPEKPGPDSMAPSELASLFVYAPRSSCTPRAARGEKSSWGIWAILPGNYFGGNGARAGTRSLPLQPFHAASSAAKLPAPSTHKGPSKSHVWSGVTRGVRVRAREHA